MTPLLTYGIFKGIHACNAKSLDMRFYIFYSFQGQFVNVRQQQQQQEEDAELLEDDPVPVVIKGQ